MAISNWKRLPTETLVRTWAICWVVFNHAHVYGSATATWTGGMTVLMMLSGLGFARTALAGAEANTVRANLIRLCRILFVPSALIVLMSFALFKEVRWAELTMVSNWIRADHLARMPLWYVQTMIQMALGLIILFSLPGMLAAFSKRPALASLLTLIAAIALHTVSMHYFDTSALYNRLPHLLLWNFVLGWCLFFLGMRPEASFMPKTIAILCAIGAASLGWPLDEPSAYWLIGCAVLMVAFAKLPMPAWLTWFVSICSQALLAIFVLHGIFLGLYRALVPLEVPVLAFGFAISASIFTWSVLVAVLRTVRAVRHGALTSPTLAI